MSLTISVRDYRGIERADIEIDRIALIAGRNEQGKSCLAEACRAALAGAEIPIPGVTRKEAKILVRDGAGSGSVVASLGESTRTIEWPKARLKANKEHDFSASDFATGLSHPFDLNPVHRATHLSKYVDSAPEFKDLVDAASDAGYNGTAIDKIWQSTKTHGWDGTHRRACEYSTNLKGQWEGVTGEKYGEKKAEAWSPSVHPGDVEREVLDARVETAKAAVLDTAGDVAVSKAEVERLTALADAAKGVDAGRKKDSDARAKLTSELEAIQEQRQALPAESGGRSSNPIVPCPECGAKLIIEPVHNEPPSLKLFTEDAAKEAKSKKVQKKRAAMDGTIENIKSQISVLTGKISAATRTIDDAGTATTQLVALSNAPATDEGAIAAAKTAEADAIAALAGFDSKIRAHKLHADLTKNQQLISILAPDGLRRRKLADGLGEFNKRLADISAVAAWPVVRLDETLKAHYGTRPVWAASKSGQWRARAIMQIVCAQIDGSVAVVMDEADMLDARGRNGLFKALKQADLRALVCMTFSKQDLVPNLAKRGLGRSYWIEDAKAEEIG